MATVTRKFRDDFETWAAHQLAIGNFTAEDMAEFKAALRRDLAPGPDQLREGLTVIIAAGVEVSAAIDDHEQRYRLWADFFAVEAQAILRMATDGAVGAAQAQLGAESQAGNGSVAHRKVLRSDDQRAGGIRPSKVWSEQPER